MESIITRISIAAPIIIFLWRNDIGMTQAEVGLSQTYFAIAVLLLEVPSGWLADRFSRKWANVIGDLGVAIGFLLYAQATSFTEVVICETLLGLSLAFTSGVDDGMVKNYMSVLGRDRVVFERLLAKKTTWTFLLNIVCTALSGPLGMIGVRFVLVLNSVPYIIGGILSLTLVDAGQKLKSASIWRVMRNCFADKRIRWMLVAITLATNISHAILWSLTLIFVQAGVPVWLVTISWVLNAVSETVGSKLAESHVEKLAYWQKFLIPMCAVSVGLAVIGCSVNLVTIWFYALIGLGRGWIAATLTPGAQNFVADDIQTSFLSLTKSLGRVLYVPLSFVINAVGDFDIRYSFLLTLGIFIVPTIVTTLKLRSFEKK